MSDPIKSLLRLRASMLLKQDKKSKLSAHQRVDNLSLKAYYLGRKYPDIQFNPFSDVDYIDRQQLIDGFNTGQHAIHLKNEYYQSAVNN